MEKNTEEYLECERHWVFALLIFVGGYYGVYTFLMRGGVFCNAQTANFVLFAIELGNMNWSKAAYYLIPMFAYLAGAFVSEAIPTKLIKIKFLRWDTLLIATELLFILALGFVPDSAPYQISQIAISKYCEQNGASCTFTADDEVEINGKKYEISREYEPGSRGNYSIKCTEKE